MNPRILLSAAAVVVAVLAALAVAGCGDSDHSVEAAEAPAERAILVRTATPAVEDVVDRTVLAGELAAWRRATLAAEVPGVIERLGFEEGDSIRRGQVLAEIDTRSLEQAVAEAKALDRQARLAVERAEKLFAKRSITEQRLEAAVTDRDVAAARLRTAELQLAKSRLVAPWAGRVASKRVEVGDYVSLGQPIAEVVDLSRLKVRAPAPAGEIPFLEVGAPATVRVNALPDRLLSGSVTRLGAEVDRGARTLTVEVAIDNPDRLLRPGMLAQIEVPRRTLEQALLVPLAAVVDLGEEDVVWIAREGRAVRRPVDLGPLSGDRVIVLSGLEAGDRVIVEGAQQVADGQRIEEAGVEGS